VGVRVVVRRVLPGQLGPTGGPAMTDLLGVLEEWGDDTVTVRREDGEAVMVERRLIVSGKPVPPRPSVRSRLDADEVALRIASTWPAVEVDRIGDWLLRSSAGFSLRANSALLAGAPGLPWDQALRRVVAFYEHRGMPAVAQVLGGSDASRRLADAGWVPARAGGVAQARRAVRRAPAGDRPRVELGARVTEAWLATDRRALGHREAAVAVLEGPEQVSFASVLDEQGAVLARGRVALSEAGDVWAGISDVWVDPVHRRGGLARAVMGAMLGWAAERGATTAYLQVTADNEPALALYQRLGFATHHTYRYVRPRA
jgi:ribosomal protein S18 acetylase RimI-like enzyme